MILLISWFGTHLLNSKLYYTLRLIIRFSKVFVGQKFSWVTIQPPFCYSLILFISSRSIVLIDDPTLYRNLLLYNSTGRSREQTYIAIFFTSVSFGWNNEHQCCTSTEWSRTCHGLSKRACLKSPSSLKRTMKMSSFIPKTCTTPWRPYRDFNLEDMYRM